MSSRLRSYTLWFPCELAPVFDVLKKKHILPDIYIYYTVARKIQTEHRPTCKIYPDSVITSSLVEWVRLQCFQINVSLPEAFWFFSESQLARNRIELRGKYAEIHRKTWLYLRKCVLCFFGYFWICLFDDTCKDLLLSSISLLPWHEIQGTPHKEAPQASYEGIRLILKT